MAEEGGSGQRDDAIAIGELATDAFLLAPSASQTGTLTSGLSQTWTADGSTLGFQIAYSTATTLTVKTQKNTLDDGTGVMSPTADVAGQLGSKTLRWKQIWVDVGKGIVVSNASGDTQGLLVTGPAATPGWQFGAGGSTNPDVTLYRTAANTLTVGGGNLRVNGAAAISGASNYSIAVVTKAGAPVDGDFTTAVDGLLVVNTSTNDIYWRSSGAWKNAGGPGPYIQLSPAAQQTGAAPSIQMTAGATFLISVNPGGSALTAFSLVENGNIFMQPANGGTTGSINLKLGGASGTNLVAIQNSIGTNVAYVSGDTASLTLRNALLLGIAGTAQGSWKINGATSGTITFTTAAVAGTWTLTWPTTAGSANQFLQTDGTGVATWAAGGARWDQLTAPTAALSLTMPAGDETTFTVQSTTQTGFTWTTSTLTTGIIAALTSTGTALSSTTPTGLAVTFSGANTNTAVTATGINVSVTNSNATSGTNVGISVAASGATTANYAFQSTAASTAAFSAQGNPTVGFSMSPNTSFTSGAMYTITAPSATVSATLYAYKADLHQYTSAAGSSKSAIGLYYSNPGTATTFTDPAVDVAVYVNGGRGGVYYNNSGNADVMATLSGTSKQYRFIDVFTANVPFIIGATGNVGGSNNITSTAHSIYAFQVTIGTGTNNTTGIYFDTSTAVSFLKWKATGGAAMEWLDTGNSNAIALALNTAAVATSASTYVLSVAQIELGANTTSNNDLISTASTGSGSNTKYVGNSSINVTAPSSIVFKNDFGLTSMDALRTLGQVKVHDYEYKEGTYRERGRFTGFIYEEFSEIKELGFALNAGRVEFHTLVPVTIRAIQQLDQKMESMEVRLERAEEKIRQLEAEKAKGWGS